MKNIVKIVVTFEPIMQFWCTSRFRIRRTIKTYSILWRNTKKTWYFGHYRHFCDIETDMATLWPTQPREPIWWKSILWLEAPYLPVWAWGRYKEMRWVQQSVSIVCAYYCAYYGGGQKKSYHGERIVVDFFLLLPPYYAVCNHSLLIMLSDFLFVTKFQDLINFSSIKVLHDL